ncbi:MAG: hypothetical protein VR70_05825 [Rhodospirillaceae bacterium BRH_c57]|nr:MAG: hypothetical protein VR70_05825 [Rhodospirillaceae bacterium BRH_c57]
MPSTENYSIFKADVFLGRYGSTDKKHIGNVPALSYAPEVETLEHYSSMAGVREKDAEVTTTTAATLSMTLDEITSRAIAIAMLGEEVVYERVEAAGQVAVFEGVKAGDKLALPHGVVSGVTITDGTAVTPVDYTLTTHYTVDAAAGVITIVAIPATADDTVEVAYDADAIVAGTRKVINLLADTTAEWSLFSVGTNDVGKRLRIEVGRFKITPSGELGLITDEWATLEVEGSVLRDTATPGYPFGRVIELN